MLNALCIKVTSSNICSACACAGGGSRWGEVNGEKEDICTYVFTIKNLKLKKKVIREPNSLFTFEEFQR